MNLKSLRILMFVTFGVLIILLFVGGWLLFKNGTDSAETVVSEQVAEIPTTSPTMVPTEAVQTNTLLPLPNIQEFPTVTPLPTAIPTDTPVPTETPLPPDTPTAVPPTAVPIIPTAVPPTATPIPPTAVPAGPQPGNHNGLIGTSFGLQPGRSEMRPNGKIWYEWTVGNTTGSDVPYSSIGVLPRRNGVDLPQWYQNNWGDATSKMPPGGLTWGSWMAIPEAGDYTIRLVVCFDGFETCRDGRGTYHTLSQEIAISLR
jgi:hypothetical protein